ncbi:MAG: DUF4239 domain-containing protein [Acidobacteria bacterium]|nr:DUF4239 domain-containing protein [Acidobacteriota bacterium]
MNPLIAAALIIGAAAAAIVVMLLIRRRAPEGGYFADSDRASSVFGFLGAGFVILLGFVIFLSFGTYDNARTQSEVEATAVSDQFGEAEVMPPAVRDRAQAQLVCYARSVIHREWVTMEQGAASPVTKGWIVALEQTQAALPDANGREDAALNAWYEATKERELGRRARLLVAQGEIPPLLWALIAIAAALVVGYVFLYADPAERWLPQVVMAGGVAALVVASLLAVAVLAVPFQNESGSIEPSGMQYTLGEIDAELAQEHRTLALPCDAQGVPRPS